MRKLWRKIKNATSPFIGPVVILIKKATSKIGGKIKKIKFPFIKVATVIAIGLMIALLFIVLSPNKKSTTTKSIPAPTPKPSASDTVDKILQQEAKWSKDQYTTNNIDESKDKSKVGGGHAFALDGAKTTTDLVKFLKSDQDSANALLNQAIEATSSSKEEVLDPSNWVAVQSNIPFSYPGNTGFIKGEIVPSGILKGNPGDIFFIYVSPTSGKVIIVRGACANPQTVVPKPAIPASPTPTPTPTPTPKPTPTLVPLPTQNPNYRIITNPAPTPTPTPVRHSHGGGSSSYVQPKASDSANYKAPGSDGTNGSGTDTKNPRPAPSALPAATPAPVQTSHNSGGSSSRVTDSSSSKPGSTSGATAPGASTDTTPRSVPAPAQSNNSGNADTGAPANPF